MFDLLVLDVFVPWALGAQKPEWLDEHLLEEDSTDMQQTFKKGHLSGPFSTNSKFLQVTILKNNINEINRYTHTYIYIYIYICISIYI